MIINLCDTQEKKVYEEQVDFYYRGHLTDTEFTFFIKLILSNLLISPLHYILSRFLYARIKAMHHVQGGGLYQKLNSIVSI